MNTAINQNRLLNLFQTLVSIDCESFHERSMADFLIKYLRGMNIVIHEDDTAQKINGTAGCLYASIPATEINDRRSPVLFCAHMDTVAPGIGKKTVIHNDGTITSDGTTVLGSDDASAIAEILEALQSIIESGVPHRTFELLFFPAEEAYTVGSTAFDCSVLHSSTAYIPDISGDEGLCSATEPTLISFRIEVKGKASHAGFDPEEGKSALSAAASAITLLPEGRVDSETTFNIGTIHGGTATNIIPDSVVLEGEIRSLKHETAIELCNRLKNTFEEEANKKDTSINFTSTVRLHAYRIENNDPALVNYRKACQLTGINASPITNFGGSDSNTLRRHGIASLTIANGMHKAHTCEEYTTEKELLSSARIIAELMQL
jgi:tripeptide aminopeptidase